jgi:hypothetical protein
MRWTADTIGSHDEIHVSLDIPSGRITTQPVIAVELRFTADCDTLWLKENALERIFSSVRGDNCHAVASQYYRDSLALLVDTKRIARTPGIAIHGEKGVFTVKLTGELPMTGFVGSGTRWFIYCALDPLAAVRAPPGVKVAYEKIGTPTISYETDAAEPDPFKRTRTQYSGTTFTKGESYSLCKFGGSTAQHVVMRPSYVNENEANGDFKMSLTIGGVDVAITLRDGEGWTYMQIPPGAAFLPEYGELAAVFRLTVVECPPEGIRIYHPYDFTIV